MAVQCNFKRREIKYVLTAGQRAAVEEAFAGHMRPDEWGASTVCNVYYDTPSQLIIRRSLDKPDYKEKIRVRSYGPASAGGDVFLELKKKYDGVVYKRRCTVPLSGLESFFDGSHRPETQIEREIAFAIARYDGIAPYVYLAYDREAHYAIDDHEFRVTFDRNIRFRTTDVSLAAATDGEQILPSGASLMEVKAGGAIPLWFVRQLSAIGAVKTSFSKYGQAYTRLFERGEVAFPKATPHLVAFPGRQGEVLALPEFPAPALSLAG